MTPFRFQVRTTAHHRTDDAALRPIYAAIAQLRAYSHVHDVAQRVEFYSRRSEGGEWFQHLEISGRADPEAGMFLDTVIRRHPGWVLSRE